VLKEERHVLGCDVSTDQVGVGCSFHQRLVEVSDSVV